MAKSKNKKQKVETLADILNGPEDKPDAVLAADPNCKRCGCKTEKVSTAKFNFSQELFKVIAIHKCKCGNVSRQITLEAK